MTLPHLTVDEQNDRELLELAAQAAGVPAYWSTDGTVRKVDTFKHEEFIPP